MTTSTDTAAAELARFFAHYAKDYHAGAYATPLAGELAANPGRVRQWRDGPHRTAVFVRRVDKRMQPHDFTGWRYELPRGSTVVTHLARTPGAPVPDLRAYGYVYAHPEDHELVAGLKAQGRTAIRVHVSAAAELRACYAPLTAKGVLEVAHAYADTDRATITQLLLQVPPEARQAMLSELASIDAWHDDYPYYSDGSWSAVSLRGFRPDDPTWGIKPSEMPRDWQAAHPEAAAYVCDWTTLAEQLPVITGWVRSVPWWARLERVRLLRMSGMDGKGGALARHTDIQDRNAGLRPGQVARFHVPLVTDPAIQLHAWDLTGQHLTRHLAAWGCYYLDARKPHAVTNPTGVDRVHLVVDVIAGGRVADQVADAYRAAL